MMYVRKSKNLENENFLDFTGRKTLFFDFYDAI